MHIGQTHERKLWQTQCITYLSFNLKLPTLYLQRLVQLQLFGAKSQRL